MTKIPTITTNEGPPAKNVRIKANIVLQPDSTWPVVIKPFKLELLNPSDSVPAETRFTIINVSRQTLSPIFVSAPGSLMSVTLPKSIPPKGSGTVTVKIKRAGLKNSFDKSITLEFNDEAKSRFTVPVVYRVPPVVTPVDTSSK